MTLLAVTSASSSSAKHKPSAREVLAINVVTMRQAKGWSQDVLAAEAGLHRTFVAHVERQARNISLDNVERLAHALGMQTYELLKPPKHPRERP